MELNRNRLSENKATCKPIFFFFFFLFMLLSFCSSSSTTSSAGPDDTRHCSSAKAGHTNLQPISNCATWQLPADGRKVARAAAAEEEVVGDREDRELRLVRRQLGGPGSSPPRCTLKCGKCTPCTAVRVLVHPGTPVKAEYYPEAWRCKCGDKLFMP